jgi:putative phosphonate metabolism protein
MRVAVYFAPPPDHPLSREAAAWLGRDAWTGVSLDRGTVPGFGVATVDALTADPRRYGFHATLKPPFRLAEGRSLDELRDALASFSAGRPPVLIETLRLERIGPFFALTPDGDRTAVHALADDVVRAFDGFRAPPSKGEIARRRPELLTPRQREYLTDWGYPYVFEEFRMHLTLTGQVPEEYRAPMEAVLRERFAAFIGRPLALDRLCLFVEPTPPGDFVVDTAIPLTGPGA